MSETKNHSMHGGMKHESSGHMMHTKMFKRRFFVCLALTIPVLLFSEAIQTWFQFTITFTNQDYVLLLLALIIYGYGGWPFLKGLTQELRRLQPGMMTLISTAISVAFFYSAATVFFPIGKDFFWELATFNRCYAFWTLD
jgi:Cu2+-exporting ATPase